MSGHLQSEVNADVATEENAQHKKKVCTCNHAAAAVVGNSATVQQKSSPPVKQVNKSMAKPKSVYDGPSRPVCYCYKCQVKFVNNSEGGYTYSMDSTPVLQGVMDQGLVLGCHIL
ncbi:Uncharacterised protein g2820 [Pycnogonum litorale]